MIVFYDTNMPVLYARIRILNPNIILAMCRKRILYNFYFSNQVLGGAFQAFGWPGVVTVMANWFGKGKKGLLFGIWNSHTSVGNILGGILAGIIPTYYYYTITYFRGHKMQSYLTSFHKKYSWGFRKLVSSHNEYF